MFMGHPVYILHNRLFSGMHAIEYKCAGTRPSSVTRTIDHDSRSLLMVLIKAEQVKMKMVLEFELFAEELDSE